MLNRTRIDSFEQDADGTLTNWSGCGNDLRLRSAMARRLIIDSATYLVETFGVVAAAAAKGEGDQLLRGHPAVAGFEHLQRLPHHRPVA